MPPITQIKKIKLYAPSLNISVFDFILKPSQSHAAILRQIRKALNNPAQAWPYNLKREPIDDFKTVEAGQTLLVATCYFERPLNENLDDVFTVQAGAALKAWMGLKKPAKRKYIATLDQEAIYLTLAFEEVRERLANPVVQDVELSLKALEENWGLSIDAILGFQGMIMPYGHVETWEENLLSAMVVLSEATLSQGMEVSGLLDEEVRKRRGQVVERRDVVEVGRELYRKAIG